MSASSRKLWRSEVNFTQEDDAIIQLVDEFGSKNWKIISQMLLMRFGIRKKTPKQCRERWHNNLAPSIDKNFWNPSEEGLIFSYQLEHGNQWSEISKLLEGRTDNAIKNFFYSALRRKIRWHNKNCIGEEKIDLDLKEFSKNKELMKSILQERDASQRRINKSTQGFTM